MRWITVLLVLASSAAAAQSPSTRTLSRPQAEFAEPFSDVGSVRELRDGRIVVVDSRELTVKLIDFRSGATTTIGRHGEGPGEYRWPGRLYALPGDTTLLQDNAAGRLLLIHPDGTPGALYDPNRIEVDSARARAHRFFLRFTDARGYLYAEAQPIKVGVNGTVELADSSAIVRLDRRTGRRDTVAMWPQRRDANARLVGGTVITQPSRAAWPAWDHWTVGADGRIAFVYHDPYRVDYVDGQGRIVPGAPVLYERIRVDDALKREHREERERPAMGMSYSRGGGSTIGLINRPYTPPPAWPDVLPAYKGSAVFAPDGSLWIHRHTAAGRPPLYDIIVEQKLVARVELPTRTRLAGFGQRSIYLVRLDEDDLQYLQRYAMPAW